MAPVALITGASSGIGEEFARTLSARGYELVLVARREDRLNTLADELPTTCHVITCDLGADAASLPAKVAELGLDIDLLINNAGFGARGRFAEIPEGRDAEMVRVNCEAVVILTRAFVPGMIERDTGGVITVASTAGMQPLPYETTYSASKAFARTFSDALHGELRGTGVKVLVVNPGPVPTEWQQVSGYTEETGTMPGAIPASQVVSEAMRSYDRGRRTLVPGRFFRNMMRFNSTAPAGIKLRVSERIYRPKS